ncbi:hypothetical protein Taro_046458, partial [Colocasia esculenta]|nr:hypothetical protein [Colocasia esculenta]
MLVRVLRLWSLVVAPVFRELLVSAVPAALAGKGLVIPTEPYSRGLPPYSLQMASFPAGSGRELQESVAAVAGCVCFERGCYFARAAFGFVFGLRIR